MINAYIQVQNICVTPCCKVNIAASCSNLYWWYLDGEVSENNRYLSVQFPLQTDAADPFLAKQANTAPVNYYIQHHSPSPLNLNIRNNRQPLTISYLADWQ